MTTRQAAYRARKLDSGERVRVEAMLSREAVAQLDKLAEVHGSRTAALEALLSPQD